MDIREQKDVLREIICEYDAMDEYHMRHIREDLVQDDEVVDFDRPVYLLGRFYFDDGEADERIEGYRSRLDEVRLNNMQFDDAYGFYKFVLGKSYPLIREVDVAIPDEAQQEFGGSFPRVSEYLQYLEVSEDHARIL